jgi:membrane protein implicated in regulation of membrane protease activity
VKKAATIIQIVIIFSIIIYGTVSLFFGHFEGALITFPFLLFYYVYIVARQKRRGDQTGEDESDGEGH